MRDVPERIYMGADMPRHDDDLVGHRPTIGLDDVPVPPVEDQSKLGMVRRLWHPDPKRLGQVDDTSACRRLPQITHESPPASAHVRSLRSLRHLEELKLPALIHAPPHAARSREYFLFQPAVMPRPDVKGSDDVRDVAVLAHHEV